MVKQYAEELCEHQSYNRWLPYHNIMSPCTFRKIELFHSVATTLLAVTHQKDNWRTLECPQRWFMYFCNLSSQWHERVCAFWIHPPVLNNKCSEQQQPTTCLNSSVFNAMAARLVDQFIQTGVKTYVFGGQKGGSLKPPRTPSSLWA